MYKNRLTLLFVIDWHMMSELQQINQCQEREIKCVSGSDTEKIRTLDELRRMKRKEKKMRWPKEIRMPLPKPLFERQFTDCCDLRYVERHPEAPEDLKVVLTKHLMDNRRMTIEELSTDDRRMTIEELLTDDRRMTIEELSTDDRRMTIEELSTDDRRMTIEELMSEREYLIHRVREYVEKIFRERSDSQGDTDLLAKKRIPR